MIVDVSRGADGQFLACAMKKSAAGFNPSFAARNLAKVLGYSAAADVRYVRTDGDGHRIFAIVEVSP